MTSMDRSPEVKRAESWTSRNGFPDDGPVRGMSTQSHCSTDAVVADMQKLSRTHAWRVAPHRRRTGEYHSRRYARREACYEFPHKLLYKPASRSRRRLGAV